MVQAIKGCTAMAPKDSGGLLTPGCEVSCIAPPEQVGRFMELADDSSPVEDAWQQSHGDFIPLKEGHDNGFWIL